MSYTRAEAVKIINAYNTLRTWALEIVSDVPYTASVEYTDNPSISISGDEVILFWKEYDSDYYGSGSLEENEARFPVAALVFNAKELRATREKVKAKGRRGWLQCPMLRGNCRRMRPHPSTAPG